MIDYFNFAENTSELKDRGKHNKHELHARVKTVSSTLTAVVLGW
jgi:hypothetical protein